MLIISKQILWYLFNQALELLGLLRQFICWVWMWPSPYRSRKRSFSIIKTGFTVFQGLICHKSRLWSLTNHCNQTINNIYLYRIQSNFPSSLFRGLLPQKAGKRITAHLSAAWWTIVVGCREYYASVHYRMGWFWTFFSRILCICMLFVLCNTLWKNLILNKKNVSYFFLFSKNTFKSFH